MFVKIPLEYVEEICKIGIPTALQGMAYCFISMILTRMVAGFGPEAIATQRVGGQIESISWNTADGFGAAMNAFIGQNYGAGKTERVKKGYRVSLWTVGIWGLLITLMFVCVPTPIASVFFHEKQAIATAVDYLIIVGFSEAFLCVEMMTVGALSGLGRTRFEAFCREIRKERALVFRRACKWTRTIIIYEAPHHLVKTLEELESVLGSDRKLTICRGLQSDMRKKCRQR